MIIFHFLDSKKIFEISENKIILATSLDREEKSFVKVMMECTIVTSKTCFYKKQTPDQIKKIYFLNLEGNETSSGPKNQTILELFRKNLMITIHDLNDNQPFLTEEKLVIGVIGNELQVLPSLM